MAEMLAIWRDDDIPVWLDDPSKVLLAEGRAAFRRLGLGKSSVLRRGGDVHLFTRRGSRANGLLAIVLGAAGLRVWAHDVGVVVSRPDRAVLMRTLAALQEHDPPPLETLAVEVAALTTAKYAALLPPAVLQTFWAMSMRDCEPVLPSCGWATDRRIDSRSADDRRGEDLRLIVVRLRRRDQRRAHQRPLAFK